MLACQSKTCSVDLLKTGLRTASSVSCFSLCQSWKYDEYFTFRLQRLTTSYLTPLYIYLQVLSNCLLGKSKLRRSSSVAPAGKLTRRDSENKVDVKVRGELRIFLITDCTRILLFSRRVSWRASTPHQLVGLTNYSSQHTVYLSVLIFKMRIKQVTA